MANDFLNNGYGQIFSPNNLPLNFQSNPNSLASILAASSGNFIINTSLI